MDLRSSWDASASRSVEGQAPLPAQAVGVGEVQRLRQLGIAVAQPSDGPAVAEEHVTAGRGVSGVSPVVTAS